MDGGQWSVFTHVTSGHIGLLKQRLFLHKNEVAAGMAWYNNMAAFSLFGNTDMAAKASHENALFSVNCNQSN